MKRFLPLLLTTLAASAGTFLNDTFTGSDGTNLTLHVGELAAAWNKPNTNTTTLGPGSAVIASNRLRGNSTVATTYLSSAVPADRAQTITVVFRCVTVAGNSPWVGMRMDVKGTNGYRIVYDIPSAHWKFQYNNQGGGWVTAVIDQAQTLSPNTSYTAVWTIDNQGGSNDNVSLTIDGGTPLTTQAGIVKQPGCPAVGFDAAATASTDSTGIHIESVVATQTAASPSFSTNISSVYIGDSLMTDYTVDDTTTPLSSPTIPQLLGDSSRLNTGTFVNVAWGGQLLSEQNGLYATQVDPIFPVTTGFTNRLAFIFSGNNDLFGGASAATVLTRLQTEVTAAHASGYKTVIVTLPPNGGYDGTTNVQRLAFNASIRADHSFSDFFSDLAPNPDLQDPTNTTYFQSDHTHYTVAGRTSAATWMANDLKSVGPGRPGTIGLLLIAP